MKKRLILITALVALLAGCNNEAKTIEYETGSLPVALQVTSGIQTRAGDKTWDVGDAIGIYLLKSTTIEAANSKYITSTSETNGTFSPASTDQTIYFPVDGTARDLVAYYPYANIGSDNLYAIDVTTQSSQAAIDLMCAAKVTEKSKNDPAVGFVFKHQLVKLDIKVKANGGLSDADLAGLTVKITNQQSAGTYNVITGGEVSTVMKTAADIVLKMNELHAEGIVLPNSDTKDMKLTFTVPQLENQVFEWTINSADGSKKFEAGKKYKYTITIAKAGLTVSSTIEDWAAGNGEDGEQGNAD